MSNCTRPSQEISLLSCVPYALDEKTVSRMRTLVPIKRPQYGKSATPSFSARSNKYGKSKLTML